MNSDAPVAGLERAAVISVLAASLATALLAARNKLAPVQEPGSFALLFWIWQLAFYTCLLVAASLLAALVSRRAGLGWLASAVPRLLAGGLVLAPAWLERRTILGELLELPGSPRFSALVPAIAGLSALGLLAGALAPLTRRVALRVAAGVVAGASLGAFAPTIGTEGAAPSAHSPGPRAAEQRLLLVAVDGADWDLLEPLLARGELPHIAALRARGAWGRLRTIRPTFSPVVWTSVVTGQPPERHGIRGFTSTRLRGVDQPLPRLRPARGTGFAALYALLKGIGVVSEVPVLGTARRVPALWNLATAQGSPISVVNWWATWPAESVLGTMVSERVHYWRFAARGGAGAERHGLTQPEQLYAELEPLIMTPDAVSYEHARRFMDVSAAEFEAMKKAPYEDKTIRSEFKYMYSMFESTRRVALYVQERERGRHAVAPDLLVLFRIVDLASHSALRFSELVTQHPGASEEERRKFGRVVSEAYRSIDAALGELVQGFGPGHVMVLSDHGFGLQRVPGGRIWDHVRAPDGVFLAAGPAFRSGRFDDLGIYDMLPLLAYVMGLPVAEDLEAGLRSEVLDPAFLASHAVRRVASYGAARAERARAREDAGADEAQLERLKALGYIR